MAGRRRPCDAVSFESCGAVETSEGDRHCSTPLPAALRLGRDLGYLAAHAIPGVELLQDGVYLRTAAVGSHQGWLSVAPDPDGKRPALRATISTSLTGALMSVVARLRRIFDLDARPAAIAAHLGRDRRLARHVRARPGLRVAGAFDPFEAAARAVLGQQVSVAAGGTIAGRLTARLGETIATAAPALTHLFPGAECHRRRDGARSGGARRPRQPRVDLAGDLPCGLAR